MTKAARAVVSRAITIGVVLTAASARGDEPAETNAAPHRVSPPAVARILLPGCVEGPFDTVELLDILRVELVEQGVRFLGANAGPRETPTADPLDADEPSSSAPVAVVLLDAPDCAGTSVVIRVEHSVTQRSAAQVLDLADTPRHGRARIAAIAVAELIRTSWAMLATPVSPAVFAPPDRVTALAARPAVDEAVLSERAAARVRSSIDARTQASRRVGSIIEVAFETRLFPAYGGAVFGGAVAGFVPILQSPVDVRFLVDAAVRVGTALDPLGEISVIDVSAGVGFLVSAALPDLMFGIGSRLGVGGALAEGRPFDRATIATSLAGVTTTLSALGAIGARVADSVWARLRVEAGYVLASIDARADDRRATGIGGPLLGVGVGVGFEL